MLTVNSPTPNEATEFMLTPDELQGTGLTIFRQVAATLGCSSCAITFVPLPNGDPLKRPPF